MVNLTVIISLIAIFFINFAEYRNTGGNGTYDN